MQATVKNMWSVSALTAFLAFSASAESFTWKGGDGAWNEASN